MCRKVRRGRTSAYLDAAVPLRARPSNDTWARLDTAAPHVGSKTPRPGPGSRPLVPRATDAMLPRSAGARTNFAGWKRRTEPRREGERPVSPSDVPRPRTCRSGGRFAAAGARGRQTVRRSRDGGGFRRRRGGPIGHRGTRLSLSPSPPRRNRPSTSRCAIATGSLAPRRDSHLIWQGDHAGIRADERAPRRQ